MKKGIGVGIEEFKNFFGLSEEEVENSLKYFELS